MRSAWFWITSTLPSVLPPSIMMYSKSVNVWFITLWMVRSNPSQLLRLTVMMESFGMFYLILCICSEWQNYIFFSLLLSLRTKAEFLYGALHLTDFKSHNVAMRFLSVRPKVNASFHGFCGTFQSFAVIEVDGDDGELWH